jgi:hypothetical protein
MPCYKAAFTTAIKAISKVLESFCSRVEAQESKMRLTWARKEWAVEQRQARVYLLVHATEHGNPDESMMTVTIGTLPSMVQRSTKTTEYRYVYQLLPVN